MKCLNHGIIHKSIEMDHVKLSLVHDFFCIQSIGMISLNQFKEVIPNEQYKQCENKTKKNLYNFTQEAFFEYIYNVTSQNLFWNNLLFSASIHYPFN